MNAALLLTYNETSLNPNAIKLRQMTLIRKQQHLGRYRPLIIPDISRLQLFCIGIKKYPCCRFFSSFVCIIIYFVNYQYMIMTNDMYMNIEMWVKNKRKKQLFCNN